MYVNNLNMHALLSNLPTPPFNILTTVLILINTIYLDNTLKSNFFIISIHHSLDSLSISLYLK